MSSLPVRVRFAPSPTGSLHVGGARTALFNWLYAKHHGGKFILRIEDTDAQRSTQESVQEILDSVKWMGLSWDEGPIYQSARFPIYRQAAEKLVERGLAHKVTDPEKGGGEAIIFKMPSKRIVVEDLIYGRVEFDSELLKDQVLIKSDGNPAYNFACVVDDAEMRINPVIRGEDHLSNTPKQIALYEAMELSVPQFAHVPLILGPDRSRLSKRHGATAVASYKQDGYLPEALLNYLVLLGWSSGSDKEIFSLEELVAAFDLKQVSRKGAVFSGEKLQWMNAQYIKKLSPEKLVQEVTPFLAAEGLLPADGTAEKVRAVACLLKERLHVLKDILGLGACFFQEQIVFDEKALATHVLKKENIPVFARLCSLLEDEKSFHAPELEKITRGLAEEFKRKTTPVVQAMRVALTGKAVGAGLFDTMALLGRDVCLKRLRAAAERMQLEPSQ